MGVYEYEDVGDVRNGRCRTTGASAPVFLCPGKDVEEGMSGRGRPAGFGAVWAGGGGWGGLRMDGLEGVPFWRIMRRVGW